ncbi:zinc finger protein 606 isoform X2 [Ceratitis capitata]|uniref:zinc finger protein 606 isoform X2 n=1 Tax=Ceratitis capitata TaxID=7213 RepID=UPI000A102AC5|nr:zinc finger protein 606 isoform X2 [Ceratitis capitata]
MSTVIDLNLVCIICLQDDGGKFISVFAKNESKMHRAGSDTKVTIAEKIAECSELNLSDINIKISNKICNRCLNDLSIAWSFRKNCETANSLFKSIQQEEEDVMSVANSEIECGNIKKHCGLQMKLGDSDNEAQSNITQGGDDLTDDINQSDTEKCQEEMESFSGYSIVEYIDDDDQKESEENTEYFNCFKEESPEKINETEGKDVETKVEMYDSRFETEIKQEILEKAIDEDNLENVSYGQEELFLTFKKDINATSANPKRIRGRVRHGLNENSNLVLRNKDKTSIETENNFGQISQATKKKVVIKKVPSTSENKINCAKKISHRSKSFNPSPKICEICGNIYKYQHALSAHMRRHNNDRQFGCELCEKAFVSNVELRRHMRVHTGQKPYPCSYCERRFSDFGSRSKHERTHTGERPYRCTTCNKSFAYPHVLTVHIRTHTAHLDNHSRCESISLISRLNDESSNISLSNPETERMMPKEVIAVKTVSLEECIFSTELANEENDIGHCTMELEETIDEEHLDEDQEYILGARS